MATLSADISYVFDARYEIGLQQYSPTTADIYYRGGLAHAVAATGKSTLTPADADDYAGVVSQHLSATTSDLIWVASSGIWFFACSNITHANKHVAFGMPSGDLTDNPAVLDVQSTGDGPAIGIVWLVSNTATDGWINTNIRANPANA
jgi:hypothetical protein